MDPFGNKIIHSRNGKSATVAKNQSKILSLKYDWVPVFEVPLMWSQANQHTANKQATNTIKKYSACLKKEKYKELKIKQVSKLPHTDFIRGCKTIRPSSSEVTSSDK
jgi:hypothetical protein